VAILVKEAAKYIIIAINSFNQMKDILVRSEKQIENITYFNRTRYNTDAFYSVILDIGALNISSREKLQFYAL